MIKKFCCLIASALFFGLAVSSCSDDSAAAPFDIQQVSVAEGAQINPATATIDLIFANDVALSASIRPTLNGQTIVPTFDYTEEIVDHSHVVLPVTLEPSQSYTLVIPEKAFSYIKSNVQGYSKALTVNFSTSDASQPDPDHTPESAIQGLHNPKATAEATKVFEYLRSEYGKSVLSGCMGGIAWETTYADFIEAQTGHFPAVIGFDYIFLNYSPANWIDYGDITPVKAVWEKGCIPQIQWHWNVPVAEGSSDYTFYKENNDFKAENILIDGTWESEVAKADIAELAGYLSLLQDAGIPVLWRPFHEAAGDYAWGGWFWWGNCSLEVTKQLYIYLHDELTQTYGLNNLIWVWTMQGSTQGALAKVEQLQEAYPGDEYVDMVGIDIYPDSPLTDQSQYFKLLNEAVGGAKMVALSECGNLIDMEKAQSNDALWSYYMQWYDMQDGKFGFFNYSGPDQWQQLWAMPIVKPSGIFKHPIL